MNYFKLAPLRSLKSRSKPQGPNGAKRTIVYPVGKRSFSFGALVVGVLAMVFFISFIVRAWTEPGLAPPDGNVPAPINVGGTGQVKKYIDASNKGWLGVATDNYDLNYGLTVGYGGNKIGIKVRGNSYFQGATSDSTSAALNVVNDGATSLLYVRNDGRVGIGTTAPSSKFQIGTNTVLQQWSGSTPYVLIQGMDNEVETIGFQIKDENLVEMFRVSTLADGGASGGKVYIAGNVGIGTTSPGEKLEVAGQIKITGGSPGAGKVLTSDASGLASWQTITGSLPSGTSGQTLRNDGTNWVANSVVFNNGTNVGIGTTSPGYKLDVAGGIRAQGWSMIGTGDDRLSLELQGSFHRMAFNQLRFWDWQTGEMVTFNDGNVGIGTTAPSNAQGWNRVLDVSGASHAKILATEQTASAVKVGLFAHSNWGGGPTGSVGTESNHPLRFLTNYTERMRIDSAGNVGIGTTSPGYKLDVASGGATTARFGTASTDGVVIGGGLGKLTVGTIDPIFDINGEKYATYVSDFAGGVRVESSGVVELSPSQISNLKPQKYEYVIDFENLEKGSDLWLFWQTSNKNLSDVVVLLTSSFKGQVWYKKIGSTITIYGDENGEVSYRLSAPRVDYQEWDNLTKDQSLGGILVSNY